MQMTPAGDSFFLENCNKELARLFTRYFVLDRVVGVPKIWPLLPVVEHLGQRNGSVPHGLMLTPHRCGKKSPPLPSYGHSLERSSGVALAFGYACQSPPGGHLARPGPPPQWNNQLVHQTNVHYTWCSIIFAPQELIVWLAER
jgi:hypothetical protein